MSDWLAIVDLLKRTPGVLFFTHRRPDGDGLGAMFGLGSALTKQGVAVQFVSPDPLPAVFSYLPLAGELKKPEEITDLPPLAVGVDCTGLDRVGEGVQALVEQIPILLNIDHHVSNLRFGHLNWVDPTAAAAGLMAAQLVEDLGLPLEQEEATAFYTSLVTDTGSFRFSNTDARCLQTAARLIDAGADVEGINRRIFETNSLSHLKLVAHCLQGMTIGAGGKAASILVDQATTIAIGAKDEDFEGIVSYARSVEGVEVGLLFREGNDGTIKVSLRSKEWLDVNQIASQFGGGGHPRASGCTVQTMGLRETAEKFLAAVEEALSRGR